MLLAEAEAGEVTEVVEQWRHRTPKSTVRSVFASESPIRSSTRHRRPGSHHPDRTAPFLIRLAEHAVVVTVHVVVRSHGGAAGFGVPAGGVTFREVVAAAEAGRNRSLPVASVVRLLPTCTSSPALAAASAPAVESCAAAPLKPGLGRILHTIIVRVIPHQVADAERGIDRSTA